LADFKIRLLAEQKEGTSSTGMSLWMYRIWVKEYIKRGRKTKENEKGKEDRQKIRGLKFRG
jgi:hypothetical protein